ACRGRGGCRGCGRVAGRRGGRVVSRGRRFGRRGGGGLRRRRRRCGGGRRGLVATGGEGERAGGRQQGGLDVHVEVPGGSGGNIAAGWAHDTPGRGGSGVRSYSAGARQTLAIQYPELPMRHARLPGLAVVLAASLVAGGASAGAR